MSIDPYQLCPCGSGKKIKFCCRDIAADLQKIQRMIEGEQRLAALERIDKLLAKHKRHRALLGLKSLVEIQLNRWDEAEATVEELCEHAKDSALGPAQAAILRVRIGEIDEAVELLQEALGRLQQDVPQQVCEAIRLVAQSLILQGDYLAGQAHLDMLLNVTDSEDSSLLDLMLQLTSNRRIPLLLKEELRLDDCPPDVSWRREFQHAIAPAQEGRWIAALERLEKMSQRVLDEPTILRGLGVLNARLGRREQAGRWFRESARIRGVDLDDAVFAEALAQMLDPRQHEMVDVVTLTYPIADAETLMLRCLSDKRLVRRPQEKPRWAPGDSAPPRGVFSLLDREVPESSEGLTLDTVPRALGEVFVFGRETDRDARLILEVMKTDQFHSTIESLRNVGGEAISGEPEETSIGELPALHVAMASRWHFPPRTPVNLRRSLLDEQRQKNIFQRWPEQRLPELDGATPKEVADNPKYKVTLLAAILNMELSAQRSRWSDFNSLRRQLGLPIPEPIDPGQVDLDRIPLHRLCRLEVDKLKDEDLAALYRESVITTAQASVSKLCDEILRRPSMDEHIDKADVYRTMAELASSVEDSIDNIQKARDVAVDRGESPAMWLVAELSMRLLQGDGETAGRLVNEIQSRYMEEPGVSQSLLHTLAQFGLIRPDGRPVDGPTEAASPLPAADEASPGIWTPDSGLPAANSETEKEPSKLWVPGMD